MHGSVLTACLQTGMVMDKSYVSWDVLEASMVMFIVHDMVYLEHPMSM